MEVNDAEYSPFGNQGTTVFLRTDTNAPNPPGHRGRLDQSRAGRVEDVVPERKEAIENVALIGGRIVAQYLVDVQSRLRLFGLDGRAAGRNDAPRGGTVGAISGATIA